MAEGVGDPLRDARLHFNTSEPSNHFMNATIPNKVVVSENFVPELSSRICLVRYKTLLTPRFKKLSVT